MKEFNPDSNDVEEDLENEEEFPQEKEKAFSFSLKKIAVPLAAILAALAVVGGGWFAISSLTSNSDEITQEQLQQEKQTAYEQGFTDASHEKEQEMSSQDKRIDDLTKQVKEAQIQAQNAQTQSQNSLEEKDSLIQQAQKAIDDMAKDRDKWKEKYEKSQR